MFIQLYEYWAVQSESYLVTVLKSLFSSQQIIFFQASQITLP